MKVSTSRKASAASTCGNETRALKYCAKASAEVLAEAIPDAMTATAIIKVKNGRPNALCTYSAAPAACGYLVTRSEYDVAVGIASANASSIGAHTAPPT